jgi:lysophospholipase L1-like esterase
MGGVSAAFSPSSLPGYLAEWQFNQGSGWFVHNDAVTPRPTLVNLFRYSEQQFARWASGFGTGLVRTDNYANSPDGDLTASRLKWDAQTAGGVTIRDNVQLTAVPHTVSVYVASNTGLEQACRLDNGGVRSSNLTVPASGWSRISWTFTPAAGLRSIGLANDSVGTAGDILAWGAQVEVGSSATTYIRPAGHAMPFATATPATWVTGGLQFGGDASGQGLVGQFKDAFSLASGTIYFCVSCTASPADGFDPLHQVGFNNGTKSRVYMRDNGHNALLTINGTAVPTNTASPTNPIMPVTPFGIGAHTWAFSWDGATAVLYCDGVQYRSIAYTPTATTDTLFGLFSNLATRYFTGVAYYALWYTSLHTAAQVRQASTYVAEAVADRGVTVPTTLTDLVVWEGDSITAASSAVGYPALLSPNLTRLPVGLQAATTGSDISTANSRVSRIDALYDATRRNNVLCVFLGANDLNIGSANVTTIFDAFKAYGLARKAVGWKVVWITVAPSTRSGNTGAGGFLVQRGQLNTAIVGDTSFYDARYDLHLNADIGVDGAQLNATYYPDGTHMSLAAHQILAAGLEPVIESVIV